ncbi:MAG: AraC family transcriptional regulator, partial [Rhodanobacter sp.]
MQKTVAKRSGATRDVAFFVFPGFQIQDLSGPLAAFDMAGRTSVGNPYRCHVVSLRGGGVVSSSGLEVVTRKIRSAAYDTFIVSGGSISGDLPDLLSMSHHLSKAAAKGTRRIASVCTGAFILAAAGLLDGRRATTHWKYTKRLQREFPGINVESDRIFTKDRGIWTSAGVTAGIDLALAMIEDDLGSPVSHAVAQMLVVYHRRPGGQSQFSAIADMEPESDRIREVLTYMREHLNEPLLTEQLA